MQTTLDIVLPIFGLILCGYLIGRTRLIGAAGIAGLGNFVFYVAIPALLVRTLGRGGFPDDIDFGILGAYFGGVALVAAPALLIGRALFRISFEEQVLFAMASVFANTVMIGIPLIVTAFGERGLVPILMIVAIHSLLLLAIPTVLIEVSRGRGGRPIDSLKSTAAALAQNPVLLSLAAGAALHASGGTLPGPFDRFLELLGQAATPCALFALGATLTQFRIAGNLAGSLTASLLKLTLHPLAVWLLGAYVFDIEPLWLATATITAALPTGANVFILAQKYDTYLQRAASTVVLSTAGSIVTVAILVAYLVASVAG